MALTFRFKADGTGYTKGLEKMRGQTKQWSGNIGKMVAGAFAFGAITSGIRSWTQSLNETSKAAKLLNTTAQEMEKLAFVAQKGKVEFDDLKEFISNVNERVFEGSIQAGHMADEWQALGLKAQELKDKTPTEVISMLSNQFEKTGDRASFAAAGIGLFGDDFKRVINVLEMGGDEIKKIGDKATTTADSTREKVASLSQSWIDFKNQAKGGFIAVGEWLMKTGKLIVWVTSTIVNMGITAFKVASSIGSAFKGVGKVISSAFSFNPGGMKQGIQEIKNSLAEIPDQVRTLSKSINDGLDEALGNEVKLKIKYSWGQDEIKNQKTLDDMAQKKLNLEKEIADIKLKSAQAEETARFNSLSTSEKLLDIEKQKKKLAFAISGKEVEIMESKSAGGSSLLLDKLLSDKKKLAELEAKEAPIKRDRRGEQSKEFADKVKSAVDSVKEFAEKVKQLNDDIKDLDQERSEIIAEQSFNKMSDEDKLDHLLSKQNQLKEEARLAGNSGDVKKKKELEIEALRLKPQIEQMMGSSDSDRPNIISSSLASIGAGGGVAAFGNDPAMAIQNKQLGLLEKIETHLNPASGIDASRNLETPEL